MHYKKIDRQNLLSFYVSPTDEGKGNQEIFLVSNCLVIFSFSLKVLKCSSYS